MEDHPLKQFRERQSPTMSQEALAARLGVKRITIHRWESRKRPIDVDMLPKIEAATGIPPREIRPDLAELFSGAAA